MQCAFSNIVISFQTPSRFLFLLLVYFDSLLRLQFITEGEVLRRPRAHLWIKYSAVFYQTCPGSESRLVSKLGDRDGGAGVWSCLSSPGQGEPVVLLLQCLPLVSNSFLTDVTAAHLA